METGDQRNLKYGVHRIIGRGAAVQSVSRCHLVVKRAIPLFHDGMKKLQRWNLLNQRVKLFIFSTKEVRYLCGPRLLSTFDPEGDTCRCVRDNLTDVLLEAAEGSGALMIVKTIRLPVGPKSTQEAVPLFLDFFRLDSLRRNYVKPQDTGHVDSHRNTRTLAKH